MVSNSNGGPEAGRVLNGRYQLMNSVGGGGMAHVYRARDNILGRTVAVKVLRDVYANDAQFVARFKREAQAAANLAHPNIVNVYDVGQDGDTYFIVMEYVAGESLKDVINRSAPLPTDMAVSVAAQILSALEYAHRSGLVHRDIKPQNVIMTREGIVKVTDFGIAKSVSDLGLTEAGIALGTAHYFSPEQAKGERVTPQSDLYAVGVTLFEMVTGRLLFESDNAVGLAYKHISEPPPRPSLINPNIPPRLDAIILRALSKEPQQRFASASEMEKALRNLEASGQQATSAIPVARPNVVGGQRATRQVTTRQAQPGSGASSSGTPTRAVGGAAAVAGAGATARHLTGALGAPTSVAVRPTTSRASFGGRGCALAGVALAVVGLVVLLLAAATWGGSFVSDFLRPGIVSSPTPTPIVLTPTNTPTAVPPTLTATSTSTVTPTPTVTPVSARVPRLIQLKVEDAKTLAEQAGFVLEELPRVDTPEWPAGVVFQQDPQPDQPLRKTSVIRVRVSNGPPPFKLPQLTNTDPNTARSTLETAGLKVEVVNEGSLNIPPGVVTRTEPPGDSSVRPGDTIKLFVSLGETVTAPDLRGMTLDVATAALAQVGLKVGAVTEVTRQEVGNDIDSVPPGTVYSQDPAKGAPVSKNGSVNLRLTPRQ